MHQIQLDPADYAAPDTREEVLAMIRMIEFVRTNLPPEQRRAAEKQLHDAIESISESLPAKNRI